MNQYMHSILTGVVAHVNVHDSVLTHDLYRQLGRSASLGGIGSHSTCMLCRGLDA